MIMVAQKNIYSKHSVAPYRERLTVITSPYSQIQKEKSMSFVVCCATLEVRYRKRGGGCKVLNDNAIQVSEVDSHLNGIMRKTNFGEFISVKMTNIHQRPLCSADSDDSDVEVEETDDVGEASGNTETPAVVIQ